MIQYMLLFSRQGKLRLQKWYNPIPQKEKRRTTRELITLILSRKPKMCSFLEYRDQKIVYKRYASLFFCVAIDPSDNELLTLEIIHRYDIYIAFTISSLFNSRWYGEMFIKHCILNHRITKHCIQTTFKSPHYKT